MPKKIIILISILIIITFNINSFVPNFGNLDESKSINKNDYQLGSFISIISTPLLVIYYFNYEEYSPAITSYNYLYQRIPVFNLGFMGRFGIGNDIELGTNTMLTSLPFLSLGFLYYYIELYSDFSFKKTFFNKNDFFIAYKFNFGTSYLFVTRGANFILKNSIIMGKKINNLLEFNIIPSIQNNIFAGIFDIFGGSTYGSVTPQVDFNLHFFIKNLVLVLDFFIFDELIFARSSVPEENDNYRTIMLSTLSYGISFGINFRKEK